MKKAFCFLLTLLIGMLCIVACSKDGENSTDSVQKTISFVNSELTMNVGEKVQADVITSQKNVLVPRLAVFHLRIYNNGVNGYPSYPFFA